MGGPPGGVAPELEGVTLEVEGLADEETVAAPTAEEEAVEPVEAGPAGVEAAVLAGEEDPNAEGTGLRPLARAGRIENDPLVFIHHHL